MTALNRVAVLTACTLALAFAMTASPAMAKDPVPDNPADAARKYCAGAYKRYCSKIPAEGLESLNCLKQNIKRLPRACRKAVEAL
ncbi:MAG: hypothetical protein WBG10_03175 [Pseudolabrys sp.]